MAKVTCSVETITPIQAKIYLEKNFGNRPISRPTVDLYVRQMQDGLWKLNNDAISFGTNGRLLNGQHRLTAVIESNKEQQFVVVRGLEDGAFVTMDNGKNRIASDVLASYGVANERDVASIIKRKILLTARNTRVLNDHVSSKQGGNPSRTKVSNAIVLEEYYRHKDKYIELASIAKSLYSRSHLMTSSEYGGIIAYLTISKHYPQETPVAFFEELVDKRPTSNNTVMVLRHKLTQDALSKSKLIASVKQKLIIKAWNAYVTGKSLKHLQYNENNDKDIWFV